MIEHFAYPAYHRFIGWLGLLLFGGGGIVLLGLGYRMWGGAAWLQLALIALACGVMGLGSSSFLFLSTGTITLTEEAIHRHHWGGEQVLPYRAITSAHSSLHALTLTSDCGQMQIHKQIEGYPALYATLARHVAPLRHGGEGPLPWEVPGRLGEAMLYGGLAIFFGVGALVLGIMLPNRRDGIIIALMGSGAAMSLMALVLSRPLQYRFTAQTIEVRRWIKRRRYDASAVIAVRLTARVIVVRGVAQTIHQVVLEFDDALPLTIQAGEIDYPLEILHARLQASYAPPR